VLKLCINLL